MTLEKASEQALFVHLLEPLFDVDELPDLIRLIHLLQRDQEIAPATAVCLAHIMPAYFFKEVV